MTYEVIDEDIHNTNQRSNETTVGINEPLHETTCNNDINHPIFIQEEENEYDYAFDLNLDEDFLTDSDDECSTMNNNISDTDAYNNNDIVNENSANTNNHNIPSAGVHSQCIFDRCEFNKIHTESV